MKITEESLTKSKEFLTYDGSTGEFTWLKRTGDRCNVVVGSRAGAVTGTRTRYRYVHLKGERIPEHRLAWAFVHGPFEGIIDHINGDSLDNRIDNLRLATRSQNAFNSVKSKSRFKGVTRKNGRWRVQLRIDGKQKHFGYFDNEDDAIAVAKQIIVKHHGEFARY